MSVVNINISVYVPDEITARGIDVVEQYFRNKLMQNPEFFGDNYEGNFNVPSESEPAFELALMPLNCNLSDKA